MNHKIKKALVIATTITLFLMSTIIINGCSDEIEQIDEPADTPQVVFEVVVDDEPNTNIADVSEEVVKISDRLIFQNIITCYCGRHDIDKISTAPLNMYLISDWSIQHDTQGAKLLNYANVFDNIHELTYLQWEGAGFDTLLFWSDETIYNMSIVALSICYEEEVDWQNVVFYTSEVIGYFEELNPADIIVLNVAFSHYILPHGGIIFTNQEGEEKRMFFHGWDTLEICESHFNLRKFNEAHPFWDEWTWLSTIYTIEQIQETLDNSNAFMVGAFGEYNPQVISVMRVERDRDYIILEGSSSRIDLSNSVRYKVETRFKHSIEDFNSWHGIYIYAEFNPFRRDGDYTIMTSFYYFNDDNGKPVLAFLSC